MLVERESNLFFISGGATRPAADNGIILNLFVAPPEIKSSGEPFSTDMALRWSLGNEPSSRVEQDLCTTIPA